MRKFVMKFKDKEKLDEMLHLRREGWTYVSLGLIYGVDHSSIYMWCKKMNIPVPKITIGFDLSSLIKQTGIKNKEDNVKMYKDYLAEIRRKKFPKLYSSVSNV